MRRDIEKVFSGEKIVLENDVNTGITFSLNACFLSVFLNLLSCCKLKTVHYSLKTDLEGCQSG